MVFRFKRIRPSRNFAVSGFWNEFCYFVRTSQSRVIGVVSQGWINGASRTHHLLVLRSVVPTTVDSDYVDHVGTDHSDRSPEVFQSVAASRSGTRDCSQN